MPTFSKASLMASSMSSAIGAGSRTTFVESKTWRIVGLSGIVRMPAAVMPVYEIPRAKASRDRAVAALKVDTIGDPWSVVDATAIPATGSARSAENPIDMATEKAANADKGTVVGSNGSKGAEGEGARSDNGATSDAPEGDSAKVC